jgi:hypothetical protein
MKKNLTLTTYLVVGISALGIGFLIYKLRKTKGENKNVDKMKNYIIGDSQTPFIDKNSVKAMRVSEKAGKQSLWEGGQNLNWLKAAVNEFPVSADVNSIIINIGTNGGFNLKDDVSGLVTAIKTKFPNAKIFAVKGSWGWGGNKNVTESKVADYYKKFSDAGVQVLTNAIGSVKDPHSNLPIYAKIGAEIDKQI